MPGRNALALIVVLVAGGVVMSGQSQPPDPYHAIAEHYVKLVLALGQHDADYVDAFYGPAQWRKDAEVSKKPLATIDTDAAEIGRAHV